MRIAIIGAGNVGAGIGLAWVEAGHDVRWGVRNPGKYPDLPAERLLDPVHAIEGAEAILLATPWPATEAAIAALGNLTGRIIIDATNPLRMGEAGLELSDGFTISGGEQVAAWATGAHVVKTLNQTGSDNMGNGRGYARPSAMFVAGDDSAGKKVATGLVADLGFDPIDAGPLRNSRLLEPLAMLWIDQAWNRGRGLDFAFTIETPSPD